MAREMSPPLPIRGDLRLDRLDWIVHFELERAPVWLSSAPGRGLVYLHRRSQLITAYVFVAVVPDNDAGELAGVVTPSWFPYRYPVFRLCDHRFHRRPGAAHSLGCATFVGHISADHVRVVEPEG